jgi:hypothetical protein
VKVYICFVLIIRLCFLYQLFTDAIADTICGIKGLRPLLIWSAAIVAAVCMVVLLYISLHRLIGDMAAAMIFSH